MKKRRARQVESPSRNILHFTDREDEQELFARLLAQPEGGHLPVLSFYGVGGTGKSWLLNRLRASLASAGEVPYAHLDFAIDKGGELYQRDPAAALAEIQRQLGVECPRFAVAYHLMLWKQGKRDTLDSPVGETASTGWQIAVALGQDAAAALVPGVNVAGKLLEKAIVDAYDEYEQRAGFAATLEDNVALPFETEVLGVTVTVERIDLNEAEEIVALCRRGEHRQAIPILDLPLPTPLPGGAEWILAYRYWARGE